MADAATLRSQIDDVLQDISAQKRVLDGLDDKLAALRIKLHALPYPILDLPPEIVGLIFVHCLSTIGFSPGSSPTKLTQVCHAWRQIAVTTPALWVDFKIHIDERGWRNLEQFVEMWLSRSGDLPISFVLCADRGWASREPTLHGFMRVLNKYSRRIKRMEIQGAIEDVLKLQPVSWDTLDSVYYCLMYEGMPTTAPHIALFKNAPNLRQVEFNSMLPCFFDLAWANVRVFNGAFYDASHIQQMLDLLENVEDLELETNGSSDEREETPRPLVRENVRRFCVVDRPNEFSHILDFFTFPQLETLELTEEISEDTLRSFLVRSAPPLTKLILTCGEYYNDISTTTVLEALPTLTFLALRSMTFLLFANFVDNYGENATFLPNLEHLSISCGLRDTIRLDDLVKEVGSAVQNRRNLKTLRLSMDPGSNYMQFKYPDEQLDVYRQLERDGVQVHIGTDDFTVFGSLGCRSCP